MTRNKEFIRKIIQGLCWFVFLSYCVQTGALAFNYLFSLFRPIATLNLHRGLDLSALYQKSTAVYTLVLAVITVIAVLKGYAFFLALKAFRVLDRVRPSLGPISSLISRITFLVFSIGVISVMGQKMMQSLTEKGYNTGMAERYCNDGGAYLMMSAILFVVALLFQ